MSLVQKRVICHEAERVILCHGSCSSRNGNELNHRSLSITYLGVSQTARFLSMLWGQFSVDSGQSCVLVDRGRDLSVLGPACVGTCLCWDLPVLGPACVGTFRDLSVLGPSGTCLCWDLQGPACVGTSSAGYRGHRNEGQSPVIAAQG